MVSYKELKTFFNCYRNIVHLFDVIICIMWYLQCDKLSIRKWTDNFKTVRLKTKKCG